jgi:hypothetical protein
VFTGASSGSYRIWIGKIGATAVAESSGHLPSKLFITERRR